MKVIIFIVAGLVVGLTGGTAFRGLKERDAILARMAEEKAAAAAAEHAEEDTSHEVETPHGEPASASEPDSLPGQEAPLDSLSQGEEGTHGETDPVSPEGVPDASGQGEVAAGQSESPFSLGQPAHWNAGAAAEEGSARLAKIFGAMQAKDAAAVLEKLEDGEVQAILFHLSDRKAAEILGSFTPERAATLSRTVLGSRNGNGS